MTCNTGKCGPAGGTPPPTPAPTPAPGGSGSCPSGWSPALGTLYDSWPKPGSKECVEYSGCKWAGQFNSIDSYKPGGGCAQGARMLDGGNGDVACRFPESLVKTWSMAATWERDAALLGKQLEVIVQGKPAKKVKVNVKDVCSDADCGGCCSRNTGNGAYKLIDLEKWPASKLLGLDPTPSTFHINNVPYPTAGGLRPGAPGGSVMPLCYRVLG